MGYLGFRQPRSLGGPVYDANNSLGTGGNVLTTNGVDQVTWSALGNGTLTLNTSGTGLSGSQTFSANQGGNATFTVTSNATSSLSYNTLVSRDANGIFAATGINLGTNAAAIGGSLLSIQGTFSDDDSQLIIKKPFQSVYSIFAQDGLIHIGTHVYYANSTWVHDGPNNNNQLLTFQPGSGVRWYASSNGSLSGNVSNNLQLWNDSGVWQRPLANTLTLNTTGTGLSGSTTYNNSGSATFTVTSNATSNNTGSTIVSRDASGNFSAGTITSNISATNNSGYGGSSAGILATDIFVGNDRSSKPSWNAALNISGTPGNNDSQVVIRNPGSAAMGFLALDQLGYITYNAYYENGVWVHSAATGDTWSAILACVPNSGMSWYVSSNSTASFNVSNGLLLWNSSGVWQRALANTLTLNTSGTGLSGSTTYNNSGAATFTVTSNATSSNTGSTIVSRDSSGNFSAGTITASLTGSATGLSGNPNISVTTINASGPLITTYNTTSTGGGAIYLNNGTSNRIDFNTNGVAAPALGTRSSGTKIVLYPGNLISSVDYAIGIEGGTIWSSVADSSGFFKWYANTTNIATLAGDGSFSASRYTSTVAQGTAPFTVTSTTQVNNLNVQYHNGLQATSSNVTNSIVSRDSSGNFSAGSITSSGTISAPTIVSGTGNVIGGAALVVNGTNNNDDTQLIIKKPSQSSFGVMSWDGFVFLSTNVYYTNNSWVHDAPAGDNDNQLFLFSPGSGVRWYASNNGTGSWNVANDIQLWSDAGVWQRPLSNTLTLNTSGTGLSGSTTYNNSGAVTFTVTSNATSANTGSTIVARDASGNFTAGTITASNVVSPIDFTNTTINATYYLAFAANVSGGQTLRATSGISVNPSTNTITATNFNGTATLATNVSITSSAADASFFVPLTTTASGNASLVSSATLTFNPSTGNMVVGGTVTTNSDLRLKTNIETIDDALNKVLSMRGVTYLRKDTNQQQVGVIAQEVEKVVPEVVYGDDIKSVAYGNLVGILIEAIKEQNKRIDELEFRLAGG